MRAVHIIPGLALVGSSGMVFTAYATDAFAAAGPRPLDLREE
jgi:hypothetical protein